MPLQQKSAILTGLLASTILFADDGSTAPEERETSVDIGQLPAVDVVATTPLASTGTELKKVPGNFQTADSEELDRPEYSTLDGFLFRNFESVNINEVLSNPYQPDISYRGFTASPLVGTPIGVSVYQDGVRVNESFGDTVNWDLIPLFAIDGIEMVPGSSPLFGLNTLGGALVVRTKNGYTSPGFRLQAEGGSFNRFSGKLTYGGSAGNFNWFAGANISGEKGWRDFSRSSVTQGFVKGGWENASTNVDLSYTYAHNRLTGDGAVPADMLSEDWSAVYVQPERTTSNLNFVNLNLEHSFTDDLEFTANIYYRELDQGVYAADNELEFEEDEDEYELEPTINRTSTRTHGHGGTAQLAYLGKLAGFDNYAAAGFNYAHGKTDFTQSSQDGELNADLGIDPIDAIRQRTDLQTKNTYYGLYLTDTFSVTPWLHVTGSGRWNEAKVKLDGWGTAEGERTDLDGDHSFSRFNPAGGFTLQPLTALGMDSPVEDLTLYANYSEGFRVPTPAELACADPDEPCALPTNFAADPPLKPVVSHTYEVGLRGRLAAALKWNLALYRIDLDNEILFTNAPGSLIEGFFQNVSKTRRQGAEIGLAGTWDRLQWFANYSYVDATYRTDTVLQSAIGPVQVQSGDRIPSVPKHLVKAGFDYAILDDWHFGADLQYVGRQYLRGDDSNQYSQLPDYLVVNLNTRYRINKNVEVFAIVKNVTDKRYKSYGLINRDAYSDPVGEVTAFYSPGAPIGAWAGLRMQF